MMIMRKVKKRLSNQQGMTLVELLICLAIAAIIGAALVNLYLGDNTEEARIARANDDLGKITTAIQVYTSKTGFRFGTASFPATNSGLNTALFNNFNGANGRVNQTLLTDTNWTAFGTDVNDPWGRAYRFTTATPFRFSSDGPDGVAGNADDIVFRVQ